MALVFACSWGSVDCRTVHVKGNDAPLALVFVVFENAKPADQYLFPFLSIAPVVAEHGKFHQLGYVAAFCIFA